LVVEWLAVCDSPWLHWC